MTYERLITAVDEVAPQLSDIAYKLLWRLIALAIHSGSPEVRVSIRGLAAALSLSKGGVARAIRELAQYITVTPRDGEGTTCCLPPDWFPPQRTLFAEERLGGNLDQRPNSQDTSVLFPRTPASYFPGHQRPISQDTRPICQDTSVPFPRTPVPPNGTKRPISQDTETQDNDMGTRARVDRSIDPNLSAPGLIDRIDTCCGKVEIEPHQREDAEILRGAIMDYRETFTGKSAFQLDPDDAVIAHILAIAEIGTLCRMLRTLQTAGIPPRSSDMWFFFVLMDKLLGAPKELVRQRMTAKKSKAHSVEQRTPLFGDQLLADISGKVRKIG